MITILLLNIYLIEDYASDLLNYTLKVLFIDNYKVFLLSFFNKYPEYQKFFPAFKDVTLEELPTNKKFQAHCLNVVTALNNVIDSINDLALLEANLIGIGERHHRRGQTKEQFLVSSNVPINNSE
jgi:hypothetical protein